MACDKERFNRFFHAMLDAGIYFAPSAFEAGFVSAAHTARGDRAHGRRSEKSVRIHWPMGSGPRGRLGP